MKLFLLPFLKPDAIFYGPKALHCGPDFVHPTAQREATHPGQLGIVVHELGLVQPCVVQEVGVGALLLWRQVPASQVERQGLLDLLLLGGPLLAESNILVERH